MKIIFFVNIMRQARCIRRIEDFINNGYDVEVYGFDREGDNRNLPSFNHTIIGEISSKTSYYKRLIMMVNSIKSATKHQEEENAIYYIFSLDVAIAFLMSGNWNRKYIYEVSDLMELEVGNKIISNMLIKCNQFVIKQSVETIMTSPGFERFLFPSHKLNNITIIQNKLNRHIIDLHAPKQRTFDINNIVIGFTGAIRNEAIYNFVNVIGEDFPNIHLKFHGIFTDDKVYANKIKASIEKYKNIEYCGPFKNPNDFPEIYSNIDMVLSLYTAKGNDKVLEPNKLYEAIYYEKPIIVSKDTFTGDFVESQEIGFTVNGEDKNDIKNFLNSITTKDYLLRSKNCASIAKSNLIDDSSILFDKLKNILN